MSRFSYTDKEREINKVLKMNQDISASLQKDQGTSDSRKEADLAIASCVELLRLLGKDTSDRKFSQEICRRKEDGRMEHGPKTESWDDLVKQAEESVPGETVLEDIMSEDEINAAFGELEEINREFSRKTSIVNKTDLSFLMVATALQVAKSLLFPHIAKYFHYGEGFDPAERKDHDDESIRQKHKEANDRFRDKYQEKHGSGCWINMLYQTPPYDITRGSQKLGLNIGGPYHRMYTLGHDPVLGWLFGTMNILTDIITLNDFRSFRVMRKPHMEITGQMVPAGVMAWESYEMIRADRLNLPAAVFAEACHLKSDAYTKVGLPIPILSSINENFASRLYKSNYDALCFARDTKIAGASFVVSKVIDLIIGLVHGLFCPSDVPKDLFEARTRKILLISNSIASASTIINAKITSNPKNLDIGSLLNTVSRLFTDVRFIWKVKQEFIESEIEERLKQELEETDRIYSASFPL